MTILVIDTNMYAGNFEREMVAFMTGQVGECGVGGKAAAAFQDQFPDKDFEDLVVSVPDERGCCRPASIYPSPYYWNDGLGHEYPNSISPEENPEIVKTYNEEARKHKLKELTAETMRKYPGYSSVACFLDEMPDEETLSFLINRALEFAKTHKNYRGEPYGLVIHSARVIETKVEENERLRREFELP